MVVGVISDMFTNVGGAEGTGYECIFTEVWHYIHLYKIYIHLSSHYSKR